MSGQTTTWFRQARLAQTFLGVALPFSSFDVALTRRVPASNADVSNLDEFFQYGYSRVNVALGSANWQAINNVEVANKNAILFPRASGGGWGTLHGWALIANGINQVCAVGTLVQPLRCVGGIQPNIPAGSIVFGEHD